MTNSKNKLDMDIDEVNTKTEETIDMDIDLDSSFANETYNRLSNAETGAEKDKWIRTRVAPEKGSTAYGPTQITGSLMKGAVKNGYYDNDPELKKWIENKFIPHANLLSKYGKRPNKEGYDPKYDYGGGGDFNDEDKVMYERMAKHLIKEEKSRNPDIDFPSYWATGKSDKEAVLPNDYRKRYDSYTDKLDKDINLEVK